jgi:hypothetical protein
VEPGMRDYYTTEVHVRVTMAQGGRWRTRTIHPSTTHFASEAVAVNDAARRALWSVSNTFRDRIEGTDFRFVPSKVSGMKTRWYPWVTSETAMWTYLTQIWREQQRS